MSVLSGGLEAHRRPQHAEFFRTPATPHRSLNDYAQNLNTIPLVRVCFCDRPGLPADLPSRRLPQQMDGLPCQCPVLSRAIILPNSAGVSERADD
jgi:hypothetical protein